MTASFLIWRYANTVPSFQKATTNKSENIRCACTNILLLYILEMLPQPFSAMDLSKWKTCYTSRFPVPKHRTGEHCNHHADPSSFNRQWPQWYVFPFIVYEKFEKVLISINKIAGQIFKLLFDLHSVVVLHVAASLLDVEHVDGE